MNGNNFYGRYKTIFDIALENTEVLKGVIPLSLKYFQWLVGYERVVDGQMYFESEIVNNTDGSIISVTLTELSKLFGKKLPTTKVELLTPDRRNDVRKKRCYLCDKEVKIRLNELL